MKIPHISLELNNKDIETLITKYTDKSKLSITSIKLDKTILIHGHLPIKAINFPFCCEFELLSTFSSVIKVKINSFKACNMVLPAKLKDIAFKTFLSLISLNGISIDNNLISLELKELLSDIEISQIEISKILISNNTLSISFKNICSYKPLDELLSIVV